jgi:sensor histidine kinase YesM
VPQLILQPIVENAVRHGIAPYGCGGEIAVRAVHDNQRLLLTVEDSGPGILDERLQAHGPSGLGLANTRARLSQLYGEAQHLKLENLSGGGFRVRIEIPFYMPERNEGPGS